MATLDVKWVSVGSSCNQILIIHGNCIWVASGFVKWDVSQSIPYGLNSCGGLAITSLFSISRVSPITCVCESAIKLPSPPHSFSHTLPYSLTVRAAGWLGSYRSFSRGSIDCLPACLPSVVYCSSAMARAALWSPRPGTNVSHFSGRLWCL